MKVITDMGYSPTLTDAHGRQVSIGRFGVWEDGEVIDTSDDLDALQTKHGPDLRVFPVLPPEEKGSIEQTSP